MDRIIKCVGRRRLVVSRDEQYVTITITLGDPPHGRHIASLQLEPIERDKLLAALTEGKANA